MKKVDIILNFNTKTGKTYTQTVKDAKTDIDGETVSNAMSEIIAAEIFGKEDLIASAKNAYLRETEITLMV